MGVRHLYDPRTRPAVRAKRGRKEIYKPAGKWSAAERPDWQDPVPVTLDLIITRSPVILVRSSSSPSLISGIHLSSFGTVGCDAL